jgi:hypothetical protein
MEDALIDGFFMTMPLLLIGGVAAQWLALRRFDGGWKLAAWVPFALMGAALAVAVLGVMAGSNLAPIWVVFALPLCLLWLAGLWMLRGIAALARG